MVCVCGGVLAVGFLSMCSPTGQSGYLKVQTSLRDWLLLILLIALNLSS